MFPSLEEISPDMLDTDFLRRIRDTVQAVEPSAECILFGSRARGDAREDSDWDVLVEGEVTFARKSTLIAAVLPLELATLSAISLIICDKISWQEQNWRIYLLQQSVNEEGIAL